MLVRSWFNSLKSRFTRPPTRQQRRASRRSNRTTCHPLVEPLEDRRLLTFVPAVTYPAGASPQAVVTADFNGDTQADLAVANCGSSDVSVLLSNPDGTFQPALTSATGGCPQSLAVGDFNNDGTLDIATANAGDVSVLRGIEDGAGNGTGQFAAPESIGNISSPQSVAVGDFNGDGKLDLGVTSNYFVLGDLYCDWVYGCYYKNGHYDGQATVLLGNGDGSFSGPNTTGLGFGYHSLAVAADLNGDLFDDFVTFNGDYDTVNVLGGTSSGYLQYQSDINTGDYSYSLAAGYVDSNGATDLVVANYFGNSIGVLLGDGSGGFSAAENYSTSDYPVSVTLGDFTGDGNLDVAEANYYSNNLALLYGGGDGTFSPSVQSAGGSYWLMAAGDFNNDGWLDAATAAYGDNNVSVLINDHSWPTPPPTPPPSVSINDAAVTEGNSGSTTATFTLSLSFAYATPITVHYETANDTATAGSDYTAAEGDLIFPAGVTSMTVPIVVLGDRTGEINEFFVVNISTSDALLGDRQGVGTIADDEPKVSINDVTVMEGNTGSVNATFKVTLSAASDVPVTVHYATADDTATAGSDYTAKSGDVTIPAGLISNTFTVLVTGDRLAELTENFLVLLSAPTNAAISDGYGNGAILDNEPRLSINSVSRNEGKGKGTTSFEFTISLSVVCDQPVTVNYATVAGGTAVAGSDYQATSGSVTFRPGEKTKTITILVNRDGTRESNETFFVDLSSPSSNALISTKRGIGTILNDDR